MPLTQFLEHSHDPAEIEKRLREGPRISYLRDWVYEGEGRVTFSLHDSSLQVLDVVYDPDAGK